MGCSRVEQNCRKDGVDEELTEYHVRCLLCFLSINVIDAASPKQLRRLLLRDRRLRSTMSYCRCGSPYAPAGVPLGWSPILILLVGAVGGIVAKFPAIEASLVIAHHSTCSDVVAPLLIYRVLTLKSRSWLDLL